MSYGKILVEMEITLVTGMHIGASKEYSAIGSVDSPVVTDPLTKLPMIPGSSLKGKLRSLLARTYNDRTTDEMEKDHEGIARLFGSSHQKNKISPARILISDAIMSKKEENRLREFGVEDVTEVKFENTISRLTGIAKPRQIERIIRGAQFTVEMIYEVYEKEEALKDIELLFEGCKLLENDYLGGHGTRGYGRVNITSMKISELTENIDPELIRSIEGMW